MCNKQEPSVEGNPSLPKNPQSTENHQGRAFPDLNLACFLPSWWHSDFPRSRTIVESASTRLLLTGQNRGLGPVIALLLRRATEGAGAYLTVGVWGLIGLFQPHGKYHFVRECNLESLRLHSAFRIVRMPQQIPSPFNILCSLFFSLWKSPGKLVSEASILNSCPVSCIITCNHHTPERKLKLKPKHSTVYISSNQSLEGALNDRTVTVGISPVANFALKKCWTIFLHASRPCVDWSHLRKPRW